MTADLPNNPELALARLEGQRCGRAVASSLVERVRKRPHLLSNIVQALQDGEEAAAANLSKEGRPQPEIDNWRLGYFQGAEPVVQILLREMRDAAEFNAACAQITDGILRLEVAAQWIAETAVKPALLPGLGGIARRRPLRPEDFGCLPTPPA